MRTKSPMIRRSPAGHGRDELVALADHERDMLTEISSLEIRLSTLRNVVLAEARSRSEPPRPKLVRATMR